MSRQKSNRTLLMEQERAARMEERKRKREEKEREKAIRRERRELKRKEREERRQARLRKRTTRESVAKNGVAGIKRSGESFSLQAALAYNPCDGCHRIVGNVEIVSHFCVTCEYGEKKEVVDSPVLKAKQGDRKGAGLDWLPFLSEKGDAG